MEVNISNGPSDSKLPFTFANDILDEEIPSHLIELKTPARKQKVKATTQNSNFMITFNPNVSHRALNTPEKKAGFVRGLLALGRNIKLNLENKLLLKEFSDHPLTNVKLSYWDFEVEQGETRGFLHVHAVVKFTGYCQINVPALKKFANDFMSSVVQKFGIQEKAGGMLNIKAFRDTAQDMLSYIRKKRVGTEETSE